MFVLFFSFGLFATESAKTIMEINYISSINEKNEISWNCRILPTFTNSLDYLDAIEIINNFMFDQIVKLCANKEKKDFDYFIDDYLNSIETLKNKIVSLKAVRQ